MILKIVFVIGLLYLVPCCVGDRINRILKIDCTVVKNYLIGNIFIWALFQLVTVPLVLLKSNFLIVVTIVNVVTFVICLLEIYDEVYQKKCVNLKWKHWMKRIPRMSNSDTIAMIVMEVMIIGLLLLIIMLQHTDADDSRFVVNVVEIVRTNQMFLRDPITGYDTEIRIWELAKDITSPWAVYIAYYAKMTGISAVIMAHSVLPISLILCAMSVFWLISKELFKEELKSRSCFMCLVILLHVYGYYSIYTAETFLLTRVWQGKAVVASVAIPAMYLFFMWLYENEKEYGYYVLVFLVDIAMCLMSGMGILIGGIMLGSFGVCYGCAKKKVKIVLCVWGMAILNVLYFVLNELESYMWRLG